MKQFSIKIFVPADAVVDAIHQGINLLGSHDHFVRMLDSLVNRDSASALEHCRAYISADHNSSAVCKPLTARLGVQIESSCGDIVSFINNDDDVHLEAEFFGGDGTKQAIRMLTTLALDGNMRDASILLAAAARDLASELNSCVVLPRGFDYNIPAEHGKMSVDDFAWRSGGCSMLLAAPRE